MSLLLSIKKRTWWKKGARFYVMILCPCTNGFLHRQDYLRVAQSILDVVAAHEQPIHVFFLTTCEIEVCPFFSFFTRKVGTQPHLSEWLVHSVQRTSGSSARCTWEKIKSDPQRERKRHTKNETKCMWIMMWWGVRVKKETKRSTS